MATLQKIGFDGTERTEPFIDPVGVQTGSTIASQLVYEGTNSDTQNSVTGAVHISRTGLKNAPTWGQLKTTAALNATSLRFEANSSFFRVNDVIEYDHSTDGTNIRLYKVTAVDPANFIVTVTPGLNAEVVAGRNMVTTGRVLDVGTVQPSKNYSIGDFVQEEMKATGTWSEQAPA